LASSIETTSSTTILKNNGTAYISVDTDENVTLAHPLAVASGGTGAASAAAAAAAIAPIQLQTAVASTSGQTVVDFTGIPSGVNRVTAMFFQWSLSAVNVPSIQLGVGTSPTTSGYDTTVTMNGSSSKYTDSFTIPSDALAAYHSTGSLILNRITGNTWIGTGVASCNTSGAYGGTVGGGVTLSGEIGMIRFKANNGSDTFDGGKLSISWEF